jgi:phosphate starvation-inducible PhoH-like protein
VKHRFLPGDLEQKITPYLRPLMTRCGHAEPEEMERAIARQTLKSLRWRICAVALSNNAFVILDEAQNSTTEQNVHVADTDRFEFKCVVTGDDADRSSRE